MSEIIGDRISAVCLRTVHRHRWATHGSARLRTALGLLLLHPKDGFPRRDCWQRGFEERSGYFERRLQLAARESYALAPGWARALFREAEQAQVQALRVSLHEPVLQAFLRGLVRVRALPRGKAQA